MNDIKLNPKQLANKIIADHIMKLEVPDSTKLRGTLKISQGDATLVFAHLSLSKAELEERFTRVKKSKKVLEAGKETPDNK